MFIYIGDQKGKKVIYQIICLYVTFLLKEPAAKAFQ